MFKAPNPFEEIVAKATDENLTSEDWGLNLQVCDKLSGNDEQDARNCMAAVQKRLSHRSANVQLYALTLADTLSKNCGDAVHHEIASRAFMQAIMRLTTERQTHLLVKKRALLLLREWANEYKDNDTLGLVGETVHVLKDEYYDIDDDTVSAPKGPTAEQLQAEEEELRRALELSVREQGGRGGPAPAVSSQAPTASGAAAPVAAGAVAAGTAATGATAFDGGATAGYPGGGYAAEAAPRSKHESGRVSVASGAAPSAAPEAAFAAAPPRASRVRALYDFVPSEPGELAFSRGDVIRVIENVYEHWWRGELRQEVGIFPVNYIEVLPEPSPEKVQQELEMESEVFAAAPEVDRLLTKLRSINPARDNLAEDDELQDLYQRSLSLRPKIIRLIDRYSAKVTELRGMNDKFVRARATFDEMMEKSLERYHAAGPAGTPQAAAPSGATAAAPAAAVPSASSVPSAPPAASPSAPGASSASASLPTPPSPFGPMPQEEEKRRLFEKARAEAEEYQRRFHNREVYMPQGDSDPAAAQGLAGLRLDG